MMTRRTIPLIFLVALGACAEPVKVDKPRAEMSRRERDSTIANSQFHGAGVVRKAMAVADAEAERKAMIDTMETP